VAKCYLPWARLDDQKSQPKRNRRKFFTILVAGLSQARYNSLSMEDWAWLRWETSRSPHRTNPYCPVLLAPAPDLPASLDFFPGSDQRPGAYMHARCKPGCAVSFFLGTMGFTVQSGAFYFLTNEVSRLIPGRLTE
jgi:hypothetical protein